MSELPSFDENPPQIVMEKKTIHERTLGTVQKVVCQHCDKELKNQAGLSSHINHCPVLTKTLEELYDSDILRMLVPNQGRPVFDDDSKNWVFSTTVRIPEGFVLYKITAMDRAFRVSPRVGEHTKASFMEVLIVREDKMLQGEKNE